MSADSVTRTVKCPLCGKPAQWSVGNPDRPFCSARCKQIDLGAWASETYRVAASPPEADDDAPAPTPGVGHQTR